MPATQQRCGCCALNTQHNVEKCMNLVASVSGSISKKLPRSRSWSRRSCGSAGAIVPSSWQVTVTATGSGWYQVQLEAL